MKYSFWLKIDNKIPLGSREVTDASSEGIFSVPICFCFKAYISIKSLMNIGTCCSVILNSMLKKNVIYKLLTHCQLIRTNIKNSKTEAKWYKVTWWTYKQFKILNKSYRCWEYQYLLIAVYVKSCNRCSTWMCRVISFE